MPPSPRLISQIDWLLSLPDPTRRKLTEQLTPPERMALAEYLTDWHRPERHGGAREKQLAPPGDWFVWVIRTGRGWGKTRTAAEYVRDRIDSGAWRTVNVAGPTWTDVMDTMVNGATGSPGLIGVWPERKRPHLRASADDPHLTAWNGAKIRLRAAQSAERFRGPQADGGWADEVDSWKPTGVSATEAWALFELGIRLGKDPRIVATSTPKPSGLVRALCARPDAVMTTGSMYENRANLAARFLASVEQQYGGSRLGRQEIEGELLEDVAGAILTLAQIDAVRVATAPELARVEIGVDPSGSGPNGDEQGIVVCGRGVDGEGYVLADRSCQLSPQGWARRVVDAYHELEADAVLAEANFGGEMVRATISQVDRSVPVRLVHASRGKHVRAEPILTLYEQGRIHHVGSHSKLEDQLCRFTAHGYEGDESPDRADAAVWALSSLLVKKRTTWEDLYPGEAANA